MARGDYDDMVTDDGNRRLRRGNRRTVLATLFFIIVALIVLVIYLIANPAESVSVTVQNNQTEKKDTSTADEKKSTLFNFSDTASPDATEKTESQPINESVTAEEASAYVETAPAEESSVTERVPDETSFTQEAVSAVVSVPSEESQSLAAESERVSPEESEGGALTVTRTIVDIPEETPAPGDEAAVVNTPEKTSEETAPEKSDAAEEITTESAVEKVVEALSESDNIINKTVENVSSAFENTEEPASAVDEVISSIDEIVPDGEEVIGVVKEIVDSVVAAVIPQEEAAQAEEEVSIPEETVVPVVEENAAPAEEKAENITEDTSFEEDAAVSAEDTSFMEASSVTEPDVIVKDEVPAVMESSEDVRIEEKTVSPEVITEEPTAVNPVLLIDAEDVVGASSSRVEGDSLVIRGKNGSAVKSVAQGTVIEAGRENGRKYVIVLDSDGEAVKYSGFERVTVKVKTKVKKGSVLGSIGSSSDSTITLTPVAVE
jgi:murein DD-endopeptidase MepM/ murein hydrolase activator NlpD